MGGRGEVYEGETFPLTTHFLWTFPPGTHIQAGFPWTLDQSLFQPPKFNRLNLWTDLIKNVLWKQGGRGISSESATAGGALARFLLHFIYLPNWDSQCIFTQIHTMLNTQHLGGYSQQDFYTLCRGGKLQRWVLIFMFYDSTMQMTKRPSVKTLLMVYVVLHTKATKKTLSSQL